MLALQACNFGRSERCHRVALPYEQRGDGMARRSRPVTWLELATHNVGVRKAVTATNWAYCWAVAREAIGHEPTVEEVCEWWNMSRRTAFREQAIFREAFPTLETPARIYESPEAREALARTAAAADKVEDWIRQRRARREVDGVRAVLGNVPPKMEPNVQ